MNFHFQLLCLLRRKMNHHNSPISIEIDMAHIWVPTKIDDSFVCQILVLTFSKRLIQDIYWSCTEILLMLVL